MNSYYSYRKSCNHDKIFALILPHILFYVPIYLSHNEYSGLPMNQTGSITELNKVFLTCSILDLLQCHKQSFFHRNFFSENVLRCVKCAVL